MLKVLLLVVARPQNTLVQLGKLFDRHCIEFVKNGLIKRIYLQRGQFEVLVVEEFPFDNQFARAILCPYINQVLRLVIRILQLLVTLLDHFWLYVKVWGWGLISSDY